MALKLTKSIDGKMRASLRVEFRIDANRIGEGLIYLADRNADVGETEKQLAIVRDATREGALGGTRRMLAAYGDNGMEASSAELPQEVEEAAYERAAELFPEFGGRS